MNAARMLGVRAAVGGRSDLSRITTEEFLPPEDIPPGYTKLYPLKAVRESIILRRYLKYLIRKRGIAPKALEKHRVGVCLGEAAPFYLVGGIVFPSLDMDHPGYVVRNKDGGYRHSKGFRREEAVYNINALNGRVERSFLVEGPVDSLRMFPGVAVATFGKDAAQGKPGTMGSQLDRIAEFRDVHLTVAYDGDAHRKAAMVARQLRLRGMSNVDWVRLPPAKDPGDLGYDNVCNLPTMT